MLGEMGSAFDGFTHPGMRRDFDWDLAHAPRVVRENIDALGDMEQEAMVGRILCMLNEDREGILTCRMGVVHNDANDYNVLCHNGKVCLDSGHSLTLTLTQP